MADASGVHAPEKARGAMLAAALGDAIGWPAEPRGNRVGGIADLKPSLDPIGWMRREGGRWAPHARAIPAGTYSDDTQLMLAIARARQRGPEWWRHWTQTELPLWLAYELGGGGATRRSAQAWRKGMPPWSPELAPKARRSYFDAGGNGVAMRILPHVIRDSQSSDFDPIGKAILADGITTHGHPRALVGALALGHSLWRGFNWTGKVGYGALISATLEAEEEWSTLFDVGEVAPDWLSAAEDVIDTDYSRRWDLAVEEMTALLRATLEAVGQGSGARSDDVLAELGARGKEAGSGTRSVAAAMYFAARFLADPRAGLLGAAFARGIDTDTVAAMTGGLMGSLAGDDWVVGPAAALPDADYLTFMATSVRDIYEGPMEAPWRMADQRALTQHLAKLRTGDELHLPVFGRAVLEAIEEPSTNAAKEIRIYWLRTELGVSLSLSRVSDPRLARSSSGTRKEQAPAHPEGAQPSGTKFWCQRAVEDLEKSTDFYVSVVGLRALRRTDRLSVLSPNLLLELREEGERDEALADTRLVIVLDSEAFEEAMKDLAADLDSPTEALKDGDWVKAVFADPDGYPVELRTPTE